MASYFEKDELCCSLA